MKNVILVFVGILSLFLGCSDPVGPVITNETKTTTFKVVSTNPSASAMGVSDNIKVSVLFSRKISSSTVAPIRILAGDLADSLISSKTTVNDNVMTVSPADKLQRSTVYTVIVPASVSDTTGDTLSQAYFWSFKTSSRLGGINSFIDTISPYNNATNVPVLTKIQVTCFDSTLAHNVSLSLFKVTCNDTIVQGTVSSSGRIVTFSPTNHLHYSSIYTCLVTEPTTTGIHKISAQDHSWSFTTEDAPFTPWTLNGNMWEVNVDLSGRICVAGNGISFFVAQFSSNGKLLWKTNLLPTHRLRSGVLSVNNEVYVLSNYDPSGLGFGDIFVEAYSSSGVFKWSTQISSNDMSQKIINDGAYLYAMSYHKVVKLDLNGNIISSYSFAGGASSLCISNNYLLIGGSINSGIGTVFFIRCLNLNLESVWYYQSPNASSMADVRGIASFGDSVIVISESGGDVLSGTSHTNITKYRLSGDSLSLLARNFYASGYDIGLIKCDENSYLAMSRQDNDGPVRIDLNGNILWIANPKACYSMAVYGTKVFVASGKNIISVYSY